MYSFTSKKSANHFGWRGCEVGGGRRGSFVDYFGNDFFCMIKAFFVMLLFVWYRHRLGLTLKVLITTAADISLILNCIFRENKAGHFM